MALRRITLAQVHRLAKRDRRFFNALIKNPGKALAAKGRYLAQGDLRRIERSLRKVYKISGKKLAELLFVGYAGIRPWPQLRPWPILRTRPWP